jgi:O-acetyl-ADP-ribose deacetylase (regulator of RNase III)
MLELTVIRGDISKISVDAIVNAASTSLLGGGGVNGAIHRAAGPELLEECRKLSGAKTGEAKITRGFNLPAEFVIHTPGPIYGAEGGKEAELLANCYRESLKCAEENGVETIAFPCISTGAHNYPRQEAARIAMITVTRYLRSHANTIEEVIFVVFSKEDYKIYSAIIKMLQKKPSY